MKKMFVGLMITLGAAGLYADYFMSDDFSLRGSITNGTKLTGQAWQVGGGSYTNVGSATGGLEFGTVSGSASARVTPGQGNGMSSFGIPDLPVSRTISIVGTVIMPDLSVFSGVVGAWVGFTGMDVNLMNNIGTGTDHITLRYVPNGGSAGKIQLQTNVGTTSKDVWSTEVVTPNTTDEFELRLDYNYESDLLTATVKNLTTLSTATVSTTINDGIVLHRGQFEFTGASALSGSAQVPGFDSLKVVSARSVGLAVITSK